MIVVEVQVYLSENNQSSDKEITHMSAAQSLEQHCVQLSTTIFSPGSAKTLNVSHMLY